MSPEERAEAFVAAVGRSFSPLERKALVAAIRAAEDDVLAKAIRLCSMHTGHPLYCQGYLDAIDVLRSLKSKPPEGE